MDFGKSFKHYRKRVKLTQKEAAELIGIKDYQLANYETNRGQPSLEMLKKMSKVYQVSIDKLLGNSVLQNKDSSDIKDNDYVDIEELVKSLNDIVDKMNKKIEGQ